MVPTPPEQRMRLSLHRLLSFSTTVAATLLMFPVGAGAQDADDMAAGQSSYVGARLLQPETGIQIGGMNVGVHGDEEGRNRFMFWEGNSLFAGVVDEETGNRLEMVGEFYWFESSIDRNADFYLVVLKVTSTPYPNTDWRVATEESWIDNAMLRDIGPVQQVEANVNDDGRQGAIRWDWSVPFQNYRWEPERVIEVQQTYAAGVQAEGGAMASVTEGVNIQAKGVLSANHQVKSRYTITLWRWQMLVLAGATDMSWNLVALDPAHAQDPAYHEYFLVLQAERGQPVHLNFLRIASTLREDLFLWPDNFQTMSASLDDITLTAPEDPVVCEVGFEEVDGECDRICDEGFNFLGGECVLNCGQDFENVDGACRPVCGAGFVVDGDRCVPDCPEGLRPEGEACVDDPNDACDPDRGGADCPGICIDDPDCPDAEVICRAACNGEPGPEVPAGCTTYSSSQRTAAGGGNVVQWL